nr:reverse transcriptase domain-containing protein [Tanacetum cinerariifolium]
MAYNRIMEELLQVPTEGYGEAIVIPEINADHFEIKTNLLQLAWERFKKMLRACPHHGFTELTQIDTFYNGLNENDQDSLNATAGGNHLSKTTRDVLHIIKNKSKVRYSKNKPNVSRMNTTSKENASKTDDRIDKLADQLSTLVDIVAKKVVTPTTVKAVEESCVTCGVVDRETKEITDKEQTNFQGSTAHIQPSVVPIPELDVLKFFQIFQDLHFDISFADGLLLMPKFSSTIKSLLSNKDKLFELAKIPLNENCSAMLLKKLPKKLGDPGKFLIHLSLPELTPTRMTLKFTDRSITHPKGVAEDVFVKVGKFHFLTNFVVVDFEANPRVPLILGRSFLRIGHALIDVYREEITLQEYAQEILGFSKNSLGGNPTLTSEPIISNSSHSLTPFEVSDFILEEIEAYLKDESISPEINHAVCDPKGDICLIEKLLNDDPFQLHPMDLKQGEVAKAKSLIEEPSKLELKDLPSHLEYAYLEGADKLPVIIAKDLKNDEKQALLKVLKSHKRAIAWKITDIKGIDPRFCSHKILMEEDYKPAVQSQRRVNPKIHEAFPLPVIKFPLAEELSTASEEGCHCQKDCTAIKSQEETITKDSIPQCLCCIIKFLILSFFEITQSGESLSIHISLPLSIHNKKWINNIPPLPKYQSWIQEDSSNGSFGYNNIFNTSIMPCG